MSVQVDIVNQVIEIQIVEDEVVSVAIWDGISILENGSFKANVRSIDFVDTSSVDFSVSKQGSKAIVSAESSGGGGGGSGDVVGPSSVLDNEIVLFDGTTGKRIKGSGQVITDKEDVDRKVQTIAASPITYPSSDAVIAYAVPLTRTINGQTLAADRIIPNTLYYTRSGKYLINAINATALTTVTLGANSLRAAPMIIAKPISFTEIISEVTTLAGSTTYRIGIYTDLNGYPDQLVAGTDIGTYDSGSTGVKSSGAVNITLTPGLYWVAFNSNGAATLRAIPMSGIPQVIGIDSLGSANVINTRWVVSLSYTSMPSTFTAGASAANANAYAIGLLMP